MVRIRKLVKYNTAGLCTNKRAVMILLFLNGTIILAGK